jgi:hypothetical protein
VNKNGERYEETGCVVLKKRLGQGIKKPSPSGKGFELLAEIYGKSVVVKCG